MEAFEDGSLGWAVLKSTLQIALYCEATETTIIEAGAMGARYKGPWSESQIVEYFQESVYPLRMSDT